MTNLPKDLFINRFKNIFAKDENGVPINWKSVEINEIKSKYTYARREIFDILGQLKSFQIRKRGETTLSKYEKIKITFQHPDLSFLKSSLKLLLQD